MYIEEEKLTHPAGNIYFWKSIQSFRLKTFLLVLGASKSEEEEFYSTKNNKMVCIQGTSKRLNRSGLIFGGKLTRRRPIRIKEILKPKCR